MQRSGVSLLLARLGFIALVILAVPLTALAVLFAAPLEPWRRAKAEQLLSDAIDLKTSVKGPVQIGFSLTPTIRISDIAGQEDDMPETLQSVSAKTISQKIA
jgi:lipopolysaccharide export LptBFGC system permease protein LptF